MNKTRLDQGAFIRPDWPAPTNVVAYTTTRHAPEQPSLYANGDAEQLAFADFNLADHVGDDSEKVRQNRRRLTESLHLPGDPFWLNQCHSNLALPFDDRASASAPQADACYSVKPNQVCVVMTADCLPLLLCHRQGNAVAAVHAGWRGLLDGVIENTIAAMALPGADLIAWMGPAIGPRQFEVGAEVRQAFIDKDADAAQGFQTHNDKYMADIYFLARQRLTKQGLVSIYGGQFCSYSDTALFYSYRRDGKTGRMASLIYFHE